jgi:hypothetical protein
MRKKTTPPKTYNPGKLPPPRVVTIPADNIKPVPAVKVIPPSQRGVQQSQEEPALNNPLNFPVNPLTGEFLNSPVNDALLNSPFATRQQSNLSQQGLGQPSTAPQGSTQAPQAVAPDQAYSIFGQGALEDTPFSSRLTESEQLSMARKRAELYGNMPPFQPKDNLGYDDIVPPNDADFTNPNPLPQYDTQGYNNERNKFLDVAKWLPLLSLGGGGNSALSPLLSLYGGYQQGLEQRYQGDYNQQLANYQQADARLAGNQSKALRTYEAQIRARTAQNTSIDKQNTVGAKLEADRNDYIQVDEKEFLDHLKASERNANLFAIAGLKAQSAKELREMTNENTYKIGAMRVKKDEINNLFKLLNNHRIKPEGVKAIAEMIREVGGVKNLPNDLLEKVDPATEMKLVYLARIQKGKENAAVAKQIQAQEHTDKVVRYQQENMNRRTQLITSSRLNIANRQIAFRESANNSKMSLDRYKAEHAVEFKNIQGLTNALTMIEKRHAVAMKGVSEVTKLSKQKTDFMDSPAYWEEVNGKTVPSAGGLQVVADIEAQQKALKESMKKADDDFMKDSAPFAKALGMSMQLKTEDNTEDPSLYSDFGDGFDSGFGGAGGDTQQVAAPSNSAASPFLAGLRPPKMQSSSVQPMRSDIDMRSVMPSMRGELTYYSASESGADPHTKAGRTVIGRLTPDSLSLSPDIEKALYDKKIPLGTWVDITMKDAKGKPDHFRRFWDDRTAGDLRGRVDFHIPGYKENDTVPKMYLVDIKRSAQGQTSKPAEYLAQVADYQKKQRATTARPSSTDRSSSASTKAATASKPKAPATLKPSSVGGKAKPKINYNIDRNKMLEEMKSVGGKAKPKINYNIDRNKMLEEMKAEALLDKALAKAKPKPKVNIGAPGIPRAKPKPKVNIGAPGIPRAKPKPKVNIGAPGIPRKK